MKLKNEPRNKNKKIMDKEGITLVALVITVVIMLILAGVAISTIAGEGGIFSRASRVATEYENAAQKEAELLNELIGAINMGANEPKLVGGMEPVVFDENNGITKKVQTGEEWYNYDEQRWANAETADGSLWVWIPRFAYKITYYENESKTLKKGTKEEEGYKDASGEIVVNTGTEEESEIDTIGNKVKSNYGSIEVVFLNGTSNQYYKKEDEKLILRDAIKDGYIVHPAFKDGKGDYSNGEWKSELTGFWIAKFQAGWQYGDNDKDASQKEGQTIARSSVFYTAPEAFVSTLESGVSGVVAMPTRNYLDGEYGNKYSSVKISYPVFKGNNYAMNYITVGESFSLARVLNEKNNPYGFSTVDSDTHLEKSSEWGAASYLGYSQYGLNGENIHINNKSLQNEISSVYVVTGWAGTNANDPNNTNSMVWYTKEGQTGSTTGNITGVYDMSGALHERAASYIANGNENLSKYGDSFVTTKSTEYVTIYAHDADYDDGGITTETEITDEKRKQFSRNNYKQNYEKYGDAIYETSTSGEYQLRTGFNADYSCFPESDNPFITYGARWIDTDRAGIFAFWRNDGAPWYVCGFRAVVCPI